MVAEGTSQVGQRIKSNHWTYELGAVLGNGSFGVVCEAQCVETGDRVAIKKVLQDPRYKNRELDVMKQLNHPNVVLLKDYFFTEDPGAKHRDGTTDANQRYLSVVMEFVPDTVYKVVKGYSRADTTMPIPFVQVYAYQMIRSLGYLHSLGICHRDIKPQNLLVNVKTHALKLCDFGSAKRLFPGEASVSYICSRFYRAPELMLGATEYTCAIDIWSMGCVLAEMLTGRPLFAGNTSVDQLVRIIQVLGSPTRQQMDAMNPQYVDFNFPDLRRRDWRTIIPDRAGVIPPSAYDLLDSMLKFVPSERSTPYEALAHPFFDVLRDPDYVLPGNVKLPPLFNFSEHEFQQMHPDLERRILPRGMYEALHGSGNSGSG